LFAALGDDDDDLSINVDEDFGDLNTPQKVEEIVGPYEGEDDEDTDKRRGNGNNKSN
jgi:hypothetical protein